MNEARRTRSVSSTALIYCEGIHDLIFFRYLIGLYSRNRQLQTKFRPRHGNGGSPDSLLRQAMNIPGAFDRRLVKADKDRSVTEIRKAEALASENNIYIIWSKPCIEAMLMTILDGNNYSGWQSSRCKRAFESRHISAANRRRTQAYAKHYPITALETARQQVDELNQMIEFITN